jgi:hypothetical protein
MVSHYTTKTPPNPQINRLSGGFGLFIHRPTKGVPFRRLSSSVLTTPQTATPNSRRQNVSVCAHPLFTALLKKVKIPDGKNNRQTAIQTAKFCRLRSALIFCGFETLYRYRFCKISASDRVYYIYPCRGIYNNPGRGGDGDGVDVCVKLNHNTPTTDPKDHVFISQTTQKVFSGTTPKSLHHHQQQMVLVGW